jgi:two-component system copper resistance phosphate regulon response regulator CusR
MRILLVEDEPKTAAYLRKGLSESGFVVDVARDGEEGLQLATTRAYDLLVCDVMLPRIDGWSVVKELRSREREVPIILLTARDGVEDRVKGLNLGADDYLVKPFAFSELLARVRSVLRRGGPRHAEVIRIEDLEIDLVRHRVTRGGADLALSPKEFALLSLLARRRGEVLSRTLIAEEVWDMNFEGGTNVVDVAIRRIRAKVDDPFDRKVIETVRGMGYVIRD